jgi:hypothetical protein
MIAKRDTAAGMNQAKRRQETNRNGKTKLDISLGRTRKRKLGGRGMAMKWNHETARLLDIIYLQFERQVPPISCLLPPSCHEVRYFVEGYSLREER